MGGERIEVSAAQQHAVGAEGDHAYDIETVADAAIGEDGNVAFNRIGNRGQGAGGREHAIKLAAAVVGNHDPVCAEAYRVAGVLRIEDPLDHHRAIPEIADPLKVFPGNRWVEVIRQPADVIFQAGRFAEVGGDIAQIVRTAG